MKNIIIRTAAILLALAGPAMAQMDGFFAELPGTPGFTQALGEISPPAVTGCGRAEGGATLKKPVNFLIRGDFRAPGSIAAFDANSGDTVSVSRSGEGWAARIVIAGEPETGTITSLRGVSFTYSSGGTALTLARSAAGYIFSGMIAGGSPITAAGKPAAAAGQGGGEAFVLELSGSRLNFSRSSVKGVSPAPKLTGILTALYLALLRDAESGAFRTVDFGGRPGMDGPNYGWTSCSETNVPYVSTDVEYQQGAVSFGKVRVCEVEVTYTCNWYNCEVLYPNLEPDKCYCKARCSKKTRNTGRCEVIDAE